METLKPFFSNVESKSIYLNHTKIKSIQVCLDPASLPNIRPVYKLNDHNHSCSITFSKETMEAITDKSSEIRSSLRQEHEKIFLTNNELKVFSERMHNKCAVSFLSIQGVRLNMMADTFSQMMSASGRLALMHTRLQHRVNETAKNQKQLWDTVLAKYNQSTAEDFKTFLQQLQQTASSLCAPAVANVGNQNLNASDTSNDNDNDDEDEDEGDDYDHYDYYRRRNRRNHWDDEDEDEDEYDDDMDYY